MEIRPILGTNEALLLQQLLLKRWAASNYDLAFEKDLAPHSRVEKETLPPSWNLTHGITLYSWQDECINKWFQTKRGTIKVVTGAGKTILALAIFQKLQNTIEPNLRIAIVVPTIVLMNQWYDEFQKLGNLPMSAIGRLGGDYADDFSQERRILICVLASAYRKLADVVETCKVSEELIMVVDECHRSGAEKMSQVFKTKRKYNLGLSATPERDDDGQSTTACYEETLLGKELGPIIFELTLSQAILLGIVPPFRLVHYGLSLTSNESIQYEQLSRSLHDLERELKGFRENQRSASVPFYQWARGKERDGGRLGDIARAFGRKTRLRKELLYGIKARGDAVEEILKQEFAENKDTTAILFHESISEVMDLFMRLQTAGYPVVAEHSGLPDSIREESLDLFRKGAARIIVSAKSLIEGFNVPEADVGIIVASSSSPRQRIQSLGRMLRKHKTLSGQEKHPSIYVLYASDTVDEAIYGREDWASITGEEINIYYSWRPGDPPAEQAGPPREPKLNDTQVDISSLRPGDLYPGRYEGEEYSCDTMGNIKDNAGQYVANPGDIPTRIIALRGQAGSFRVTPRMHYILAGRGHEEDWQVIYVGKLEFAFQIGSADTTAQSNHPTESDWLKNAKPGIPYPFSDTPIIDAGVTFRQRRGGVLSKRVPGGEIYAITDLSRGDRSKVQDACELLNAIKLLNSRGLQVHKLEMNEKKDVLFRAGGTLFFIRRLQSGLDFPKYTGDTDLGNDA